STACKRKIYQSEKRKVIGQTTLGVRIFSINDWQYVSTRDSPHHCANHWIRGKFRLWRDFLWYVVEYMFLHMPLLAVCGSGAGKNEITFAQVHILRAGNCTAWGSSWLPLFCY